MEMKCGLCFKNAVEFLDLGRQPMANKYPKKADFKKEKSFRVKVYFCPHCKVIQLGTKVSRKTMFVDYYYLSSVNKVLVEHYEKFAKRLGKAKFVVDIGSNDGILLKPLKERGVKALGIDPSINVGKLANAAGYETWVTFFDSKTAKEIREWYGPADVITGLSMFSHLQDPHKFLEDVKALLTDDGELIIEVEYNKLMLKKMAFERFYLDRIFYFSATAFKELFEAHGMYLADAEITKIHGGSLRVTAKKGRGESTARTKRLLEDEMDNLRPGTVARFGMDAKMHITLLKMRLQDYKKMGLSIAGYGAPARLSTLTNFGDIGPDLIDFVVDDSPLKQGRFSPRKHIPIVSNAHLQDHIRDVIIFFAYESYDELIKRFRYVPMKRLFPIPVREV